MSAGVRTTCPYCGVGCGVRVEHDDDGVRILGDPAHPANLGRLCSKGAALGETLALEGRLLAPRIAGRETGWDEALERVARAFGESIARHGPESVAFYLSGQLLTEDYYVANKLMKGFIGGANIDTNSRLCMASAVVAHQRAFGEDVVPVRYQDLLEADLVVLVGSNLAWCHPVLYRRLAEEKARRPGLAVVVIDPRRTATCEIADLHLALAPGSDAWLFNGLLCDLERRGAADRRFLEEHTVGVAAALAAARASAAEPAEVARRCALPMESVQRFFATFAAAERVVTLFSQGVNQSTSGVDKGSAIINCHLYTGRLGKPGCGPFSITGQPNAMGGREVGGLATALAAHRRLEEPEDRAAVQAFWGSPRIASRPGLKAVDLFEAVHDGRVKALWIAGTNPVVSLPDADRARAALRRCEFVVVADCFPDTDTAALAQVLLPAAAWGEKSGTVTNSERCLSRQRAFLPLPGAARPDWWMFCELARRLGFDAHFAYADVHQIFAEHARLAHGAPGRVLDLGALADLDAAAYDALEPLHWPVGAGAPFADARYAHRDGRARLVPVEPRAPACAPDAQFPWVLNTGRVRDQWHTMTRTARSARLNRHSPLPYLDVHVDDAAELGIAAGELVSVRSRIGVLVAPARLGTDSARGQVFAPMHWSDAFASGARVGAAIPAAVDPLSGEPEFKHAPVRLERTAVDWYAFALLRGRIEPVPAFWWARVPAQGFSRYELAGTGRPEWSSLARQWLAPSAEQDWMEYRDESRGIYRAAAVSEDRLEGVLFVACTPQSPSRGWLEERMTDGRLAPGDRRCLLNGAPLAQGFEEGPIVCSCFGVGRDALKVGIAAYGLVTARQVGARLRAGTNCGSCLPEIQALLDGQS